MLQRSSGNIGKIVTNEDILYETAYKRRANTRLLFGGFMIMLGFFTVGSSFLPILAKSALPVLWVDYLNNHGWTQDMQEIGMRLIANGRIEVVPNWVMYVAMFIGMIFVWSGTHIVRTRHDSKILGDILTKGYWLHFYWMEKPADDIKVSASSAGAKKDKTPH